MDRGRSRSRGQYDYVYDYRSPSYSRSPSPRYAPRKLRSQSATRATTSKHNMLRTSAGVIAGVGLATFAVHRLFSRNKDNDHDHHDDRSRDLDSRDPRAVKDRLRRRGEDIVAHNRDRNFEEEDGPIYPRTTVRRRGDSLIYEDVVPAREVEGGLRGHRAMEARGFERRTRGESLDERRWDGGGERGRRQIEGRAPRRDEQQLPPNDRYYPRRDGDRDHPRQQGYIDEGPRR